MAPLPKRKHSTQRKGKRRASLFLPEISHAKKLPDGTIGLSHRIAKDGTYKGIQIIAPKKKKKEKR